MSDFALHIEPIYLDKVIEYAKELHKNQKRKYTEDPYFVHLEAVAKKVEIYLDDDLPYLCVDYPNEFLEIARSMLCAAYLHDSLEDTNVTHEELRVWLHDNISISEADRVLQLVVELTDVYTKENFPELNRQQRKVFEAHRIGNASEFTQVIKMCDMLDNTESIAAHDEKFAKTYLRERNYLLQCMDKIPQSDIIGILKKHEASGAN